MYFPKEEIDVIKNLINLLNFYRLIHAPQLLFWVKAQSEKLL